MEKQIFVIHGGNAADSYEEYLKDLKEKEVDLEYLKNKNKSWKRDLGEALGTGYDVYNPQMPNKENAKYLEWKIWFEKFIPYLNDDVILVGHSLGGIFLAKYLAENDFPKKIGATFLVAAPYNTPTEHPLADFNILTPLTRLEEQSGKIFIYHSKDDGVVPFSNFERYQKELPRSTVRVFTDRQHFNQAQFPELVSDIQKL